MGPLFLWSFIGPKNQKIFMNGQLDTKKLFLYIDRREIKMQGSLCRECQL